MLCLTDISNKKNISNQHNGMDNFKFAILILNIICEYHTYNFELRHPRCVELNIMDGNVQSITHQNPAHPTLRD
jgi:hypothetical protein